MPDTATKDTKKSWWESLIEVGAGVYTSATQADVAKRESKTQETIAKAKAYVSDNMTTIVTLLVIGAVVVVGFIFWKRKKS